MQTEEEKEEVEERIKEVEENIGDDLANEYKNEIISTINKFGGDSKRLTGSGRNKVWQVIKKKFTKQAATIPVGKKDASGNLVTSYEALKKLYLQTYCERLRERPIREELEYIKVLKEELFDERLKVVENVKSEPWTLDNLDWVLKNLKSGKARDPNGWCNEIFSPDVAGKSLRISMLTMFNKIKHESYIPDFIKQADVATIYKGKGDRNDLVNERGIFLVSHVQKYFDAANLQRPLSHNRQKYERLTSRREKG